MKKSSYLGFISIALIILVFASFNDLAISTAVYGSFPNFGKFFEVVGGTPAYLLIATTGACLAYINNNKIMSALLYGGSTISFTLFFSDLVGYAISPLGTDSKADVGIEVKLISIGFAIVCVLAFKRYLKSRNLNSILNYKHELLIVLIACLFQLFVQESVKIIFARPRFWTIASGQYEFQAWYQISGPYIENARMSFYSGHTANAYMSLFASFFTKNNHVRKLIIAFSLIFGTCTAISRVFMGQHFLSDVTMSFIVVCTLFYFASSIKNKLPA